MSPSRLCLYFHILSFDIHFSCFLALKVLNLCGLCYIILWFFSISSQVSKKWSLWLDPPASLSLKDLLISERGCIKLQHIWMGLTPCKFRYDGFFYEHNSGFLVNVWVLLQFTVPGGTDTITAYFMSNFIISYITFVRSDPEKDVFEVFQQGDGNILFKICNICSRRVLNIGNNK